MAVKEWFRRLRTVQLYVILFLTASYFAVELVLNYVTHSLTLLINAYHMLCNIVALIGYIAAIKYENESENCSTDSGNISSKNSTSTLNDKNGPMDVEQMKLKQFRSEKRIKNTFGWARIDVVTMLICCVLLGSFCFSLIVEALQSLIHVAHHDAMHHPAVIFGVGAAGIVLNMFCYFLIGGYTFNQGVFLRFTKEGDVVLKRNSSTLTIEESEDVSVQPSAAKRSPIILTRSQGFREMCRDVLGCVLVMISSAWVYYLTEIRVPENNPGETKQSYLVRSIDPTFAIISAVTLFALSFPYMKESILILLQTIPNHINIDALQKELLAVFPDIVNVHDLHVWQLNGAKVVATVHIIYKDPMGFAKINHRVTAFFVEMGITHVTIQPEFHKVDPAKGHNIDCLIRCQSKNCSASQCCNRSTDNPDSDDHAPHQVIISKKCCSKEVLPTDSSESVSLKKFTKTEEPSNVVSTSDDPLNHNETEKIDEAKLNVSEVAESKESIFNVD